MLWPRDSIGLVRRNRALDVGITDLQLKRAVRSGELTMVDRGRYAITTSLPAVDVLGSERRDTEVHRLRCLAAALDDNCRLALSHESAATVLGLGPNFVHVNQSGYQVSMRSAAGKTLWSRTFAGAAKVRSARSALIIETSDGASFVVDPRTGSDRVACAQCTVDEFATGLTVTTTKSGSESVEFYPFTTSSVVEEPSGRADRARVVRGPSTYPVIAPAGEGSSLAGAGRYEIIDPGTGEALWNIADPELSKANARPCGTVISVARKDRSRVFFTLSDGTRRGSMPPPALDQPDANLDAATCLGASDDVAVFANPNQLTAYDINTGQLRWTRTLLGTAEDVDGQIVLRQGSTLSKLGAN